MNWIVSLVSLFHQEWMKFLKISVACCILEISHDKLLSVGWFRVCGAIVTDSTNVSIWVIELQPSDEWSWNVDGFPWKVSYKFNRQSPGLYALSKLKYIKLISICETSGESSVKLPFAFHVERVWGEGGCRYPQREFSSVQRLVGFPFRRGGSCNCMIQNMPPLGVHRDTINWPGSTDDNATMFTWVTNPSGGFQKYIRVQILGPFASSNTQWHF